MSSNHKKKRNPWLFIPSQYFAEGIPFVLVNQLSVAMYKSLSASNIFIGWTSLLYLPWSLKLFWGPFVDAIGTKRKWVFMLQLLLGICFAAISFGIQLPSFIYITLIIFTLIAFISATHDIATDGFYLHALNKKDQAFFTGIRSTFYRIAMIFAGGILVAVAGEIGTFSGSIKHGWSIAFLIAAVAFIIMYIYHWRILPFPLTDQPVRDSSLTIPYKKVFKEYFKQDKIGIILSYILLYRFGEGLLVKMVQPFLLDGSDKGGMAISLSEVGIMYGTFGVIALVIGGILGGWSIKKYGLKKLIWIMALFMNVPNLLYVYLSAVRPEMTWVINFSWLNSGWLITTHPILQSCIIIEQFGYGFGFTAFMVYLLYISKGEFRTSHYAISTGIMAVGMMLPGFISGYLQQALGYLGLFTTSVIMTIPGMFIIFFLPFEKEDEEVG